MPTPEGRVKDRVKKVMEPFKQAEDLYAHWPVQTGYGAACLDCHGCYNGLYFAIETKAPGKKPTKRQEITMEEIVNAGGKVFVIGELQLPDGSYSGMAALVEWLEAESKS